MGLALDVERVRSNEVLERTRCILRSRLSPLALLLWRFAPIRDTPIEGSSPKLMRRMPPRDQRRNTAYLNHRIPRFSWLARGLGRPGTEALTGLAIYLGGSLKQSLRPAEAGAAYLVHRHL